MQALDTSERGLLVPDREEQIPSRGGSSTLLSALKTLGIASVGAVAALSASFLRDPLSVASTSSVANLNQVERGGCAVPDDWCKGTAMRKDTLTYRDCDGDGVLDPYCVGGELLRFGYISSANGCEDNWPNGLCTLESSVAKELRSTPKHAAPNEITIIHFNDVYNVEGVLEDGVRTGGMGRAAHVVNKERERNPDRTFVVFAGDLLSPSVMSNLFEGAHMVDVLNSLKLDAASLGNHEFDFGVDVMHKRLAESNFPWLNTNLRSETGELLGNTTKYLIKEVPWQPRWGDETDKSTVKVCFFGVAYDVRETMFKDKERVQVSDVFEESEKAADHLKNEEKCDVVVPLTHQFSAQDCELSRRLGDKVDLILGGHDHSTEFTSVCGHAPFVKAASDLTTQWIMTIWLNDDGGVQSTDGRIITLTDTDPFDVEVHDKILQWNAKSEEEMNKKMGCLGVDLDNEGVRTGETSTGNWITDSVRAMHETDVALWNSGGIRGNVYPVGPISKKMCAQMHPFGNQVVKIWATGKQLKAYLERTLRCYEDPCGDFSQISGLKYEFDSSKPVGERLVRLLTQEGKEVADTQKLSVAMCDYTYATEPIFQDCKLFNMVTTNDKVPMLMSLFAAAQDAGDSCVQTQVEGRITNLAAQ